MRTSLLILLFFITITGCKSRNSVPHGIIPRDKMQMILWDMIRADEFLTAFVLNKDSSLDKKAESIRLYEQVFRIHHISRDEFQKSFLFYRSHPKVLKVMMDSLYAKQLNPPHKQDSSKRVTDSLLFRKKHILKVQ